MYVQLAVWLAVAGLVTAFVSLLTDRLRPADGDGERSKAITASATVLTTLFVFTMALLFSDARSQLAEARSTTYTEASALRDAYIDAGGLADPAKQQVRDAIVGYTRDVADGEWPLMAKGRTSPGAQQRLDDLRFSLDGMPVTGEKETAALRQVSSDIREVFTARRDRLAQLENALPPVILGGMLITGLLTMGLLVTGAASRKPRDIVALCMAVMAVTFIVYLVVQTNHAFGGDISVGPDAFQAALTRFQTYAH